MSPSRVSTPRPIPPPPSFPEIEIPEILKIVIFQVITRGVRQARTQILIILSMRFFRFASLCSMCKEYGPSRKNWRNTISVRNHKFHSRSDDDDRWLCVCSSRNEIRFEHISRNCNVHNGKSKLYISLSLSISFFLFFSLLSLLRLFVSRCSNERSSSISLLSNIVVRARSKGQKVYIYIYIYIYTHTHTYIYIYTYRPRQVINRVLLLRNCCSSAEDEDDDPDVKAQREKERRQANNARER